MVSQTLSRMGYDRARQMLLAGGLAVLVVVAVVMYIRRVDPVEVAGTLLFIPVFVCFVFWNTRGGIIAALIAAGVYAGLRYPAVAAVGLDRFAGLIASRSIAYLAFGAIGGLANKQLESSLTKLELYDQIDDDTGLFNARFFIQDSELEMSRADRYQTLFSVGIVDVPADALYQLGRRQRDRVLRDLGRLLRDSVRTVDRAVHVRHDNNHRLLVMLPETAREGANIFTSRLAENISQWLGGKGARIEDGLTNTSLTFPDDKEAIEALRNDFKAIDRGEHPAAADA